MEPCAVQEMKKRKTPAGNHLRTTAFVIVLAVVSIGIVIVPTLRSGLYMSTDAPFHLARIESLFLSLKAGVFPVKVHSAEAYSYGYGVGFFYPDCFLYFPACLMLAGFSLESSYKAYAVTVVVATWVASFAALEILQGRKHCLISACGAAMYVLSLQYVGYLYGSQSVGSYTAMAFVPLCLSELLRILYQEYRRKELVLFTTGVSCVLLSHVSTAILLVIFLALMVVLSIERLWKKPTILADLCRCFLGGTLLTIGFWLPALEQILAQRYRFQLAQYNMISEETISWSELPSILGIGMGMVGGCLVVYLLYTLRADRNGKERPIQVIAVVSLLFIVLAFCVPFWRAFGHYCEFIQFPSRLLGPATAGAVLSICVLMGKLVEREKNAGYALLVLLLVMMGAEAVMRIGSFGDPAELDEGLLTERIAGLGAGEEWLPEGANRDALTEPEKAYDPEKGGADGTKHEHGKYYDVYVPLKWEYYDVPFLYYKGYEAYLLDDNGNPMEQLTAGKADGGGYVRVYLPDGVEGIGHIMVIYRKTLLQKIAYLANVIFLSICGVAGLMHWRCGREK